VLYSRFDRSKPNVLPQVSKRKSLDQKLVRVCEAEQYITTCIKECNMHLAEPSRNRKAINRGKKLSFKMEMSC
jgi:hypothetical protein